MCPALLVYGKIIENLSSLESAGLDEWSEMVG
jgi:hypothetical protein